MQAIDRRAALTSIASVVLCSAARAGTPAAVSIDIDTGDGALTRYAADGAGKRAGVILLPGLHGFAPRMQAYQRYAGALTAKGIDAYFLSYLITADSDFFDSGTASQRQRESYEARRFEGWAMRVSAAVAAILARSDSAHRIGLLGFSLGGYVAAATAARDRRIDALAVLYAGMPAAMRSGVQHLPPLIELHGDADRNVAFAEGEQLVRLGKKLGAEAEQIRYPGKAHGFDFSEHDPMAQDAIDRVVKFFQARLSVA